MINAIEIKKLSHRFSDGSTGIDNIDLIIPKGEWVVIAGKNGSGKTTFLRHLNGLLKPRNGCVRINGFTVAEDPVRARQIVGMVFQDADSQIIGETVYDDVAFGPENLRLKPDEIKARVTDALEKTGLTQLSDQRPYLLSGGEKRRLAIAGVLAMKPEIIVFDEPFSNLDYPGIKQVLRQILALHDTGHTILLTTHDLEKVIAHADRLIFMEKGKIVEDGIPDHVLGSCEKYGVRTPCTFKKGKRIESWLE